MWIFDKSSTQLRHNLQHRKVMLQFNLSNLREGRLNLVRLTTRRLDKK
jgi:hypothetical protein